MNSILAPNSKLGFTYNFKTHESFNRSVKICERVLGMGPGAGCKATNISKGNIMLEGNFCLKNPLEIIKIKRRILNFLNTKINGNYVTGCRCETMPWW